MMSGSDVSALLGRLHAVAAHDLARQRIADLTDRLTSQRFRLLVVGEAKRGKSTLTNALIGRPLLPTGVVPVTALPTIIRYGAAESLTVTYRGGRVADHPLRDLPGFVTESRNPDNRLGVAEIIVTAPALLLDSGVDLVDTPGVGSVYATSSAASRAALDEMDAAVFVLSADSPISAAEREFLDAVRERAVALFCVLNKIDAMTPDEATEVREFTHRVVSAAVGRDVPVYAIAARPGLAAAEAGDDAALEASGVHALWADLAAYLAEHRRPDLLASVAGHAERIAVRLLDEANLQRQALEMSRHDADDRVEQFTARLAAVGDYRQDAVDVARASIGRLLTDVNDASARDSVALTAQVKAELAPFLDGQPPLTADELEERGRSWLTERTAAVADEWRSERQAAVSRRLGAVDARLTAALDRQIATVRDSAREVLGLELAIPVPAERLLPDVHVAYSLGEAIGNTTELEGAIRRRLPGRWGRRAVQAHLMDEADRLVGAQIGRIRSAYQIALRSATTALIRGIEARYTDATAGLVGALAAARDLAGSADIDNERRRLDSRIATVGEVIGELRTVRIERPSTASVPARSR